MATILNMPHFHVEAGYLIFGCWAAKWAKCLSPPTKGSKRDDLRGAGALLLSLPPISKPNFTLALLISQLSDPNKTTFSSWTGTGNLTRYNDRTSAGDAQIINFFRVLTTTGVKFIYGTTQSHIFGSRPKPPKNQGKPLPALTKNQQIFKLPDEQSSVLIKCPVNYT